MKQALIIDRIMLWAGRIVLPIATAMFAAMAVFGFVAVATTGIQIARAAGTVEIPPALIITIAIIWTIATLLLAYASAKVWQRKPLEA